jgi:hypothetical protein
MFNFYLNQKRKEAYGISFTQLILQPGPGAREKEIFFILEKLA